MELSESDRVRESGDSLLESIEHVGKRLVSSFQLLIETTVGPSPRVTDLIQALGIDKTQASRVLRAISARTPYEALHEISAPRGLALIVDAAREQGAATDICHEAEDAVEAFSSLLEGFPDGRAGLNSVLASRVPRAKEAADRDARRSVFKGFVHLRGYRIDAVYIAAIFMPSQNDQDRVDFASVSSRVGLRRLRHGEKIHVTAISHAPQLVALSGKKLTSIDDALMPISTTQGLSLIEEERSSTTSYSLASESIPVNTGVELTTAMRYLDAAPRYAQPDQPYEEWTIRTGGNAETIVLDCLVHKDIYPDAAPPEVTCCWGNLMPPSRRTMTPSQFVRIDPLDQDYETSELGMGLARAKCREVPKAQDMLKHALTEIGAEPDDFRLFRVRQRYAVAGSAFTLWFKLPERM